MFLVIKATNQTDANETNSYGRVYLFARQFHGLAFLLLRPAFRVIKATPESMTDIPNSSDFEWIRSNILGKSIAKIATVTPSIVLAFTDVKKLTITLEVYLPFISTLSTV